MYYLKNYLNNAEPAAEEFQIVPELWYNIHHCQVYESYNVWHDLLSYHPSLE